MSGDDRTNLKAKTMVRPAKPGKMRGQSRLTGVFNKHEHSRQLAVQQEQTKTAPKTLSQTKDHGKTKTENKTVTATSPPIFHYAPGAEKQSARSSPKAQRSSGALLILVLVVLSMGYLLMNLQSERAVLPLENDLRHKMSDRIEFHRTTTGVKLNQDRIKVQFENEISAPRIDSFERPKKPSDSMLSGVALDQESHYRDDLLPESQPINPDYADARVRYALEEEKFAADWEARAQIEYVEEFKRNALAAGYVVKVDSKGRVIEVKPVKRNPADMGLFIHPDSRGGSAR